MMLSRLLLIAPAVLAAAQTRPLTEVYTNNDFQITGITVSRSGRMFVNFPRWSDKYLNAVVEVMKDGSVKPYPDEYWNRWDNKPENAGKQFVCVQSVVADEADSLWILDPAAPLLATVVPGGPKLVRVDLRTNQVTRVYAFGAETAKPSSYLNDIRIDLKRNTAYMTESGVGGIVVLDLTTGKAHRALDGHPSVMAEPNTSITINGKAVLGPTGKAPQFNADGIALSHDGEYLYYQALTGSTLYRVRTSALRGGGDPARAVERVAKTFPVDGIWMDAKDRIYLSGLNQSAIFRIDRDGQIRQLATDRRLVWPDTFSEGPDGAIYITASHINEGPQYNGGKSSRTMPYSVFKLNSK